MVLVCRHSEGGVATLPCIDVSNFCWCYCSAMLQGSRRRKRPVTSPAACVSLYRVGSRRSHWDLTPRSRRHYTKENPSWWFRTATRNGLLSLVSTLRPSRENTLCA